MLLARRLMSSSPSPAPAAAAAAIHSSTGRKSKAYPQGQNPGLRYCKPYYFPYKTFAKERWLGRELLEVVSTEFRDRSVDYYRHAMEAGITTLNGKPAGPTTIIKNGDALQNVVHRHEPPVSAHPIQIIHHDPAGEFIVIDKPGSVPVHPTGRYTKNTCTEMLMSEEFGFDKVYTVNRLDRLTSGLMFVALNPKTAAKIVKDFTTGKVRKEYVARVKGKFPEGEFLVDQPLLTVDKQSGLVIVTPEGKEAKTTFNRLFYDESRDESVVSCKPLTGRTHQIRVHLQYLGHPIPNDPLYALESVWSANVNNAKGGIDLTPAENPIYTPDYHPPAKEAPSSPTTATPEPSSSSTQAPAAEKEETIEGVDTDGVEHAKRIVAQRMTVLQEKKRAAEEAEEEKKTGVKAEKKLMPRELGSDIGSSSPIKLSQEAIEIIRRLRRMKDEMEDWARWKDVVLYTKEASASPAIIHSLQTRFDNDPSLPVNRHTGSEAFTTNPESSDPSAATTVTTVELTSTPPASSSSTADAPSAPDAAPSKPSKFIPPPGFCPQCFIPLAPDPDPDRLFIYLHALRYKTSYGHFETGMPVWAREDWNGEEGWEVRAKGQGKGGQVKEGEVVKKVTVRESGEVVEEVVGGEGEEEEDGKKKGGLGWRERKERRRSLSQEERCS